MNGISSVFVIWLGVVIGLTERWTAMFPFDISTACILDAVESSCFERASVLLPWLRNIRMWDACRLLEWTAGGGQTSEVEESSRAHSRAAAGALQTPPPTCDRCSSAEILNGAPPKTEQAPPFSVEREKHLWHLLQMSCETRIRFLKKVNCQSTLLRQPRTAG